MHHSAAAGAADASGFYCGAAGSVTRNCSRQWTGDVTALRAELQGCTDTAEGKARGTGRLYRKQAAGINGAKVEMRRVYVFTYLPATVFISLHLACINYIEH